MYESIKIFFKGKYSKLAQISRNTHVFVEYFQTFSNFERLVSYMSKNSILDDNYSRKHNLQIIEELENGSIIRLNSLDKPNFLLKFVTKKSIQIFIILIN